MKMILKVELVDEDAKFNNSSKKAEWILVREMLWQKNCLLL